MSALEGGTTLRHDSENADYCSRTNGKEATVAGCEYRFEPCREMALID